MKLNNSAVATLSICLALVLAAACSPSTQAEPDPTPTYSDLRVNGFSAGYCGGQQSWAVRIDPVNRKDDGGEVLIASGATPEGKPVPVYGMKYQDLGDGAYRLYFMRGDHVDVNLRQNSFAKVLEPPDGKYDYRVTASAYIVEHEHNAYFLMSCHSNFSSHSVPETPPTSPSVPGTEPPTEDK